MPSLSLGDMVTYGTNFFKLHCSYKTNYSHQNILPLKVYFNEALMMLFTHGKKSIYLYLKFTYPYGHVRDIFQLPKWILLSCVKTIYEFSNVFIYTEVPYINLVRNVYIVFFIYYWFSSYNWICVDHVRDMKSKPFSWAALCEKLGIFKYNTICILNLQTNLQIYPEWFCPKLKTYI